MHDIYQLRAPVVKHPARIIPEPAEIIETAVTVIADVWRRAEPHVPVQSRQRLGIRWIGYPLRELVAVGPRSCEADFAQFPAADDLDGALEVRTRALLRAHLHNAFISPRRLDHFAAFLDCVRKRLFDVYVFARIASVNSR